MDVRCERIEAVLPDEGAFATACAELPEWRRRKCDAFRFDADRRRSVAAWMLLRQMLAGRGLNVDSLPVSENEFGKPAFDPELGVHFSLSHAGERVMAAVGDGPVGCDVERIAPFDEAVARQCLTDGELAWVRGAPSGSDRDRAFIRLWTRKEAYVKAVGRGFSIEPRFVSVFADNFPPDWCFRDLDFPDGYLGCVVMHGPVALPADFQRRSVFGIIHATRERIAE